MLLLVTAQENQQKDYHDGDGETEVHKRKCHKSHESKNSLGNLTSVQWAAPFFSLSSFHSFLKFSDDWKDVGNEDTES